MSIHISEYLHKGFEKWSKLKGDNYYWQQNLAEHDFQYQSQCLETAE